jgi:tetratricopeptide (TPR) repeat protein
MPTPRARCEELRDELFADDLEVTDEMTSWDEAEVSMFFESGGSVSPTKKASAGKGAAERPRSPMLETPEERRERLLACAAGLTDQPSNAPCGGDGRVAGAGADLAALSVCQELAPELAPELAMDRSEADVELDSARSSVDAWVPGGRAGGSEAPTVPYADLSSFEPLGDDVALSDDDDDDGLEAGGEERTEDALLDEPMASVPVTHANGAALSSSSPSRHPDVSDGGGRSAGAAATTPDEKADVDAEVEGWSVKQLKEFVRARGVSLAGLSEKSDLIEVVRRLRGEERKADAAAAAAAAEPAAESVSGGGDGGAEGGAPSVKLARLIRKVEDIKASGDAAFKARDFEKAERHYTSALGRAFDLEPEERLPSALLGALYSNRSGTRETLNRHSEALADGRSALRHRRGWARAHCRVAAALISLRRFDEAREAYEDGLKSDPGSGELQKGLTDVLGKLGNAAGGSEAAAAAKARGNAAFKDEKHEEAYAAYSEAIRLAPADETLYSNRSATLAKLGR